jgi:hypothetical protein
MPQDVAAQIGSLDTGDRRMLDEDVSHRGRGRERAERHLHLNEHMPRWRMSRAPVTQIPREHYGKMSFARITNEDDNVRERENDVSCARSLRVSESSALRGPVGTVKTSAGEYGLVYFTQGHSIRISHFRAECSFASQGRQTLQPISVPQLRRRRHIGNTTQAGDATWMPLHRVNISWLAPALPVVRRATVY